MKEHLRNDPQPPGACLFHISSARRHFGTSFLCKRISSGCSLDAANPRVRGPELLHGFLESYYLPGSSVLFLLAFSPFPLLPQIGNCAPHSAAINKLINM